jgi:hypothetical protein
VSRHRSVLSLAAVLACAGCGSTEPGGVARCPQTAEFGNFGCAVVAGTVRDAAGVPLAGAVVTLVPPTGDAQAYDTPLEVSGAQGEFRVEIHRFEAPDPVPSADTVPLYLRATLEVDPPAADSVLVRAIFVPVDSIPRVVNADLIFQSGA